MSITCIAYQTLEQLVNTFVENIKQKSLPSVLAKELIVIPDDGMKQWLTLALAEKLGIWANSDFVYLPSFLQKLLNEELQVLTDKTLLTGEILVWRIFSILPLLQNNSLLASYIDKGELYRLQLAKKISALFDNYAYSCSDMLSRWRMGQAEYFDGQQWQDLAENTWQYALWVKVFDEEYLDMAAVKELCIKAWRKGHKAKTLPSRISVFGQSSFDDFSLDILKALALNDTEINLYVSFPSVAQLDETATNVNRLVSAFGNAGERSLTALRRNKLSFSTVLLQQTESKENPNLLQSIQDDIRTNSIVKLATMPSRTIRFEKSDHSLQIHVCHSIRREIEVLHDTLLHLCASGVMRVSEILVILPDVQAYKPYIESIFDTAETHKHLPYSISQEASAKNGLADLLLDLLKLDKARFSVSAVFDVLMHKALRQQFGLSHDDVQDLKDYARRLHISWGLNDEYVQKHSAARFDKNTWQWARASFLSGYAMLKDAPKLHASVIPFDSVEGSSAVSLGKFLDFFAVLLAFSETVAKTESPVGMLAHIEKLLNTCFWEDSETIDELRQLRQDLDEVRSHFQAVPMLDCLDFSTLVQHLEQQLTKNPSLHKSRLQGKLVFCDKHSFHTVPFAFIAMLGLNNGDYPQRETSLPYDIQWKNPSKPPLTQADKDRYCFLQALMATRKVFYTSYIGRSIRTDAEIAPSIVISELKGYIKNRFALHKLDKSIVFEHPVHTYALSDYTKLPIEKQYYSIEIPPGEDLLNIRLEDFITFFKHPVRYFFQKRYHFHFPKEDTDSFNDAEPFDRDFFEKQNFEHRLVNSFLKTGQPCMTEEAQEYYLREPSSAMGSLGRYKLEHHSQIAQSLFHDVQPLVRAYDDVAEVPDLEFSVTYKQHEHKVRLTVPGGRYPIKGCLMVKPQIFDSDKIFCFLQHMAACRFFGDDVHSYLIGRNYKREESSLSFRGIASSEAAAYLQKLAAVYVEGLYRPLPFFLKSALRYRDTGAVKNDANGDKYLKACRKNAALKFQGGFNVSPEYDEYIALAYEDNLYRVIEDFEQYLSVVFNQYNACVEAYHA